MSTMAMDWNIPARLVRSWSVTLPGTTGPSTSAETATA